MGKDFRLAKSIANHSKAEIVDSLLNEVLETADPLKSVKNMLQRSEQFLWVKDRQYDLKQFERIFIVGAGKASPAMTKGAVGVLGDYVSGGIVIVKHLDAVLEDYPSSIQFLEGSHPVPDIKSVRSTQQLIAFLEQCTSQDLVICLISGGGSALMTSPVADVSLTELQELTRLLLACGANIGEINTLRKHLDQIKGGRLARLAYPAKLITLILSDVIGSPLDVIASGPTVADPTSYGDALEVLQRYHLEEEVPASIITFLKEGKAGKELESVKNGEKCLENTYNQIISSNYQAAIHAVESAKAQGLQSMLLTTYLRGEAREVGIVLASILREAATSGYPLERPLCLVLGGETTVTLHGKGRGGRNTELALGAVREMDGLEDVMLVTLATDGEDGPTDAAGAIVTGETLNHGQRSGLLPEHFLKNNDSYTYFDALGDLLRIGPTGTNVNDIVFLFAF